MSATVEGHYDSVRFAPYVRRAQPFQIVAFTEDWRGSADFSVLIFMGIEQAKDLHKSLGVMLDNLKVGEDYV